MTDVTTHTQSPGAALADARQKQGKSLSDISRATCILESHLSALERDDYDSAGTSATFVIGYVRSYSRVLGIDEKSLVESIEQHFQQQQSLLQPIVQIKKKPFFLRLPFVAGLAALLLFLGLGQWFFNQEQGALPVLSIPAIDSASEPVDSPAKLEQRGPHLVHKDLVHRNLANKESQVAPASGAAANTLPVRGTLRRVVPSVETGVVETLEDLEGETALAASTLAATTLAATTHAATTPRNDVQRPTQAQTASQVQPLSNNDSSNESLSVSGTDRLSLRFSDDCWLQVYDADRRRLLSRLARKGESLSLTGRAPFDVKLGNAAAAVVVVNERQVDFKPPQGSRVLRMQVGP